MPIIDVKTPKGTLQVFFEKCGPNTAFVSLTLLNAGKISGNNQWLTSGTFNLRHANRRKRPNRKRRS